MALQSSGAISLNDIAGEFGGSTPHSLNEYYGVASGIPASGTISMNQFYGASAAVLGGSYEGGYLICSAGSLHYIVAPASTQVSANWHGRAASISSAQNGTGCSGWFNFSFCQYKCAHCHNGNDCRGYWDSYSWSLYWTDTQRGSRTAYSWVMCGGRWGRSYKSRYYPVRAFRTVSY